jgi:hypothetical protein
MEGNEPNLERDKWMEVPLNRDAYGSVLHTLNGLNINKEKLLFWTLT